MAAATTSMIAADLKTFQDMGERVISLAYRIWISAVALLTLLIDAYEGVLVDGE
jgi:hypothetical protein